MELKGKNILIYGMGISGKGAAKLLENEDVKILLYDKNEAMDKKALTDELNLPEDTKVILGKITEEDFKDVDILALSPGVSVNAPDIKIARECGVEILGEIELAYEVSKGRMIAITGTNGKTTTTALVGELMQAAFDSVFVVGNIGKSFASVAEETKADSVIVAEISSFQLETIKEFHPAVTAILNLTPDHLDRHGNFENYAKTKLLIAKNQTKEEKCIINYDDEYLRELSKDITPEIIYFSRETQLEKGVYLKGDDIIWNDGNLETKVCEVSQLRLLGSHNVENIMAACAIAFSVGLDKELVFEVVTKFKAVEHRIEYVCTKKGVKYYNDSKGTNTDAASKAVEAMVSPTVIIAGGYDKGADFTDWIKGFGKKIKAMVLIGQTAEKIKETALKVGFNEIYMEENLENAVKKASELASDGEAVLLSPACASWGQFANYEERGRLFKKFANELPEE